nr:hypothetical protein [Tanacetum cinerariifolium]
MATIIEQQTALDESLVPSTQRLRIGRSNFRLPSDIQSKEATLQVVYDVLRNSPLLREFQVTADVPEIYMQEFWATDKLHHNSIRFKIDTRKSVLDLEAFREMLHISLRILNQPFADLPTEEEILDFLRFLGHSHDIRYLTDVNAKALALTVSDCLKLKCFGDFITESTLTLPIWEDFVYQVEHKNGSSGTDLVSSLRTDLDGSSGTDLEFWATAYVHQHSIRFKMDSKKNIVDLEAFREMLHISPRVPGQSFDELPFEEEILDFLRFLRHSAQIKTLTDVNINKLFQPWRLFATVINKCLTRKAPASTVLVEHKNQKKSNEIYYPRFTKVIIHHIMTKKSSIPRRNKVNWHYVRDDILFSTIKVVSRHQNTQQYGAILHIKLTTKDIRNSKAYKEYYACATREAAPKPKASARRKRGGSDSSTTPPTAVASPRPITTIAAALRLTAAAKRKQPAIATSLNNPSEVERTEAEQLKIVLRRSREETHISQHGGSSTDEGTEETESDEESTNEETREKKEESFDLIPKTPKDSEDNGNGEEDQGLRVSEGQRLIEEEEVDEIYCDVDINQGQGLQVSQDIKDSHVTLTPVKPDGQQESSSVSSFMNIMLNPISDAGTGSKQGVPDVPTDESEEEILWNSFDDEGTDDQEKISDDDEGDEGNDNKDV